MLSDYIERQLKKAAYKLLDDRTYYGEIPGIQGIWANAQTLEDCRNELRDVLESWIVVKLKHQETIPDFDISIDPREKREYA